jgi:hypothetical protein
MKWNKHLYLEGKHAFLGASQYHWLNYDNDKLIERYMNWKAVERGTRLHALAAEHISLGIKMPKTNKTFDKYVNDAIGFGMTPEVLLYFSDNCFGTADSISFKKNLLRIHDLKTGVTPASIKQLEIYAALFCLEYSVEPGNIDMELRIYQNNDVVVTNPEADEIFPIMDRIITFDKLIEQIKSEEFGR